MLRWLAIGRQRRKPTLPAALARATREKCVGGKTQRGGEGRSNGPLPILNLKFELLRGVHAPHLRSQAYGARSHWFGCLKNELE